MAAQRVVVVGAGVVGAAAAWWLADGGAEVVLVDDGRPGRATYAGAGIVSAPWRRPAATAYALTAAAVAAYPGIVERLGTGLEPGAFEVIGELFAAPEGDELERTWADAVAAEGDGRLPSGAVARLSAAEARRAFPYLRQDLAALHVSTAARVHGEALRRALVAAATRSGAGLRWGAAALLPAAGRVEGVVVGGEVLHADAVVVAAGAWSAELVAPAGVALAVSPQRGQILHLGLPADDTSRLPVVQPIGADHYLLPFADHRIVVGATRETGAGFDPRLTAGGVAHVLANALGVAPGLAGATLVDQRVGLRPATPDGDPLLGAVPRCDGLWAATGMGPQGLTVGPYSGMLVADAVLGRAPAVDLAPFAPGRAAAAPGG